MKWNYKAVVTIESLLCVLYRISIYCPVHIYTHIHIHIHTYTYIHHTGEGLQVAVYYMGTGAVYIYSIRYTPIYTLHVHTWTIEVFVLLLYSRHSSTYIYSHSVSTHGESVVQLYSRVAIDVCTCTYIPYVGWRCRGAVDTLRTYATDDGPQDTKQKLCCVQ